MKEKRAIVDITIALFLPVIIPVDLVYPMGRTSDAVSLYDLMPGLHSASPFLVWSALISAGD